MTKLAVLGMCALVGAAIATAAFRGGSGMTLLTGYTGTLTAATESTLPNGKFCTSDSPDAAVPPWVVGERKRVAVRTLRRAGFRVIVGQRGSRPRTIPPTPLTGVVVEQFPPRGQFYCRSMHVFLFLRTDS